MALTQTFSVFDPTRTPDDAFPRDLRALLTLSASDLSVLFANAPLLTSPRVDEAGQQAKLLRHAAERAKLKASANCVNFFLNGFIDADRKSDRPEDLASDLAQLGIITTEEQPRLVAILEKLRAPEVIDDYERRSREGRYVAGVLPSLETAGATVEMRAVQTSTYNPTDPIETYSPSIRALVPIVSVRLSVDEGAPKTFHFQASKASLQWLIRVLRAAEKEVDVLEGYIATLTSSTKVEVEHDK